MDPKWKKALKNSSVGDVVSVSAILEFTETNISSYGSKRVASVKQLPKPIIGKVVGACYRYEGVISRDNGWDSQTEFKSTRAILTVKVATCWAGKPTETMVEYIEKVDETCELPWLPTTWKDVDKKRQKQEVQGWPRDDAGRWLKGE